MRHLAEPQLKWVPLTGNPAQKPGSRETASGLFVWVVLFDQSHRAPPAAMPEFFNKMDCQPRTVHRGSRRVHTSSFRSARAATATRFGFADVARRPSTSSPTTRRRFDSGRPHQTPAHATTCAAAWLAPVPVRRWPCLVSRRSVFDSQRGHQAGNASLVQWPGTVLRTRTMGVRISHEAPVFPRWQTRQCGALLMGGHEDSTSTLGATLVAAFPFKRLQFSYFDRARARNTDRRLAGSSREVCKVAFRNRPLRRFAAGISFPRIAQWQSVVSNNFAKRSCGADLFSGQSAP